ncbi:MAG: phosphocholine cytidylyltransferase family protein, partial [Verrucomicrobia bacterium]|nr:phosphocholine cytidylyltransferase family protein [Verrucomicrobiota bacterium]
RMRSLTAHKPKCLVELAGRPLLEWQCAALRTAGVTEVAVVRGYRAESLVGPGYALLENPRWAQTNMVSSLLCADAWLREGECVVSYSDIVYHPDVVQTLTRSREDLSLTYDRLWKTLWSERFEDPLTDAETFRCDGNGRLLEIGGRASAIDQIQGQYMGLLKFTPNGWGRIADFLNTLTPHERDALDMTGMLGRLLAAGFRIQAVPVDGRWCEVDSDDDLATYGERLAEVIPWRHDWRWEEAA